jgi:hypothetical protein
MNRNGGPNYPIAGFIAVDPSRLTLQPCFFLQLNELEVNQCEYTTVALSEQ